MRRFIVVGSVVICVVAAVFAGCGDDPGALFVADGGATDGGLADQSAIDARPATDGGGGVVDSGGTVDASGDAGSDAGADAQTFPYPPDLSAPDGGVYPCSSTTEVSITNITADPSHAGELTGTLTPNFGGDLPDTIKIEYQAGFGGGFVSGTTDLAADFAQCVQTFNLNESRCVSAHEDQQVTGNYRRYFLARTGSITVNVAGDSASSYSTGSLSDVTLAEMELAAGNIFGGSYAPVPGNRCLHIASATWNTVVPLGGACIRGEQCGHLDTTICDPATATCAASACTDSTTCGATATCVTQGGTAGACESKCTPFGTACAGGAECVATDGTNTAGLCLPAGTAAAGADCVQADANTGCVTGYRCNWLSRCVQACDFFANPTSPACSDPGQHCEIDIFARHYEAACATVFSTDPANIGGPCADNAAENYCGFDGNTYRGLCQFPAVAGDPPMCRAFCRVGGTDCTAPQACVAFSGTAAIGLCQ